MQGYCLARRRKTIVKSLRTRKHEDENENENELHLMFAGIFGFVFTGFRFTGICNPRVI